MKFVLPTDPILTQVVPAYTGDPRELRSLAREMWRMMRANSETHYEDAMRHRLSHPQGIKITNGIGIAAPQVGRLVNLFVMQVAGKRFDEATVCINPEVLAKTHIEVTQDESCLTSPDVVVPVSRPIEIRVAYMTLRGKRVKEDLYHLAARCFLHELDHLNGVTLWQR